MKKIIVILALGYTMVSGADIFKLVSALDRNDTTQFIQMIQTITDANAARSDNHKSILMYASWIGNSQAVEHLVAKGANINAADNSGATALHLAIWKDHTQIALYLLSLGASAKALSLDGMTPEDIAIMRSNTKVIDAIEKTKPKLKSLF